MKESRQNIKEVSIKEEDDEEYEQKPEDREIMTASVNDSGRLNQKA